MQMLRLISAMLAMLTGSAVISADVEQRDFSISVDGKAAGSYSMTIEKRDDGVTVQAGRADVRLRVFLKNFVYTYSGKELWKDGRLLSVEANTNDDGTRYQLRASMTQRGIDVVVNGRLSQAPADAWTMSYWQLPPQNQRNDLSLLDVDSGRILKGKLGYVGKTAMTIDGKPVDVFQFQLRGNASADLWYDRSDRLVRQETIEEGHRTILELVRITKSAKLLTP